MSSPDSSLHSQASEEAKALAREQVLLTWGVRPWIGASDEECEQKIALAVAGLLSYVDRVSAQALERACAALCSKCAMEIPAVYFYGAWRHPCPTCGPGVYESCEAAAIRALLSDGESVASEEKEE